MRLLLLEDNADDALLFEDKARRLLDAACVHVTPLGAAERFLATELPTGVVVDLRLPDGSGAKVVQRLVRFGAPLLIYSGCNEDDVVATAIDAGACGYLHKGATEIDFLAQLCLLRGQSERTDAIRAAARAALDRRQP